MLRASRQESAAHGKSKAAQFNDVLSVMRRAGVAEGRLPVPRRCQKRPSISRSVSFRLLTHPSVHTSSFRKPPPVGTACKVLGGSKALGASLLPQGPSGPPPPWVPQLSYEHQVEPMQPSLLPWAPDGAFWGPPPEARTPGATIHPIGAPPPPPHTHSQACSG
eukprot:364512-Chlamydomonas_euryale.AAC.2